VVGEWDRCLVHGLAVECGGGNAATAALRVRHGYLIETLPEPPRDLILAPRRGNARVHDERRSAAPQPKDALDAGTVQPARRTRVPTPPAAARMRDPPVDVTGDDVRFGLVAVHAIG